MPPKRRVAAKSAQQRAAGGEPPRPFPPDPAAPAVAAPAPAHDGAAAELAGVDASSNEERPAGDAVACMFAYTAGLRMMQGQRVDIAARDEDRSGSLQLEPAEVAEVAAAVDVRQRLLSPPPEVLMATLSPRPERGNADGPLDGEACGRVLEFGAGVVCAVDVEEPAVASAPERAASDDDEEAKDAVEPEEPREMQRRLMDLQAENKTLAEQRRNTVTLLEALASSPMLQAALSPELRSQSKLGAESDINQLLLQVLTRSTSELSKTDPDDSEPSAKSQSSAAGALTPPTSAARRRKKKPSAGAGSPFRCCSAPHQ